MGSDFCVHFIKSCVRLKSAGTTKTSVADVSILSILNAKILEEKGLVISFQLVSRVITLEQFLTKIMAQRQLGDTWFVDAVGPKLSTQC
jgi:hypothetical protein